MRHEIITPAATERMDMFYRFHVGKPTPADLLRMLDEIVDGGQVWNEVSGDDAQIDALSTALMPFTSLYHQHFASLARAMKEG